jgi:hypothetical protein
MSKEHVTFSCGHEGIVVVFGNRQQRDRKVKWLAERPCRECYEADLAVKRAAESAEAAEKAKATGLPILQGSPKQIAWAESIRAKALASKDNNPIVSDEEFYGSNEEAAKRFGWDVEDFKIACKAIYDAAHAARGALLKQDDAKWWIDNNHRVDSYARDAAEKVKIHYERMLNAAKKTREAQ